jgi:hypothetical protein
MNTRISSALHRTFLNQPAFCHSGLGSRRRPSGTACTSGGAPSRAFCVALVSTALGGQGVQNQVAWAFA